MRSARGTHDARALRYVTYPYPRSNLSSSVLAAIGRTAPGACTDHPVRPHDARDHGRLTRLQKLARQYPADGERIDTRALAPWEVGDK